jgi:hypothetical protein
MILEVTADDRGRFNIPPVMAALVQGGFAQMLYYVSEDLLREAVNRTPIDTGLLRASGNVSLDGMSLIEYSSASRMPKGGFGQKTKKGVPKHGAQYQFASLKVPQTTVAQYAANLALHGQNIFTFSVGFNTPYACVIHEGVYRLGRRSAKASSRRSNHPVWTHSVGSASMQYGKVGPKFLTRAWDENEAKYIAYLKRFGGGGATVIKVP